MKIGLTILILSSLVSPASSFAALGEQVTTIDADSGKLSAKRKNADVFQKYSVQELTSDANTIKEFVNNQGVIFAIAWQGLSHPDLSVILGSYYAGFQATDKATPKKHGSRQRSVKRENLVVEKWGAMRMLHGRAYDPSLIPAGVSLNDIK